MLINIKSGRQSQDWPNKETNSMSEIRRGAAAIQEAAESSGQGGSFRPYLPSLFWKEDKEERYVLFLNEIDDVPLFDMIQFIKDENGYYHEAVAKTSAPFSEKVDQFEKLWDAKAVQRNVAIAVELEPVIEIVKEGGKTRRKPRGFEVKTTEYERRILDDDGEATDDTEEVTAPVIGYISQSPNNFFNHVANYDANDAPVVSTALKITRLGKDKSTSYSVQGYDEQPIDLSNLVEFVDGISYLNDEMDDVVEQAESSDPEDFALFLGKLILDKREAELLDDERYHELLDAVDESMDIYGNKKGKSKAKGKKEDRPTKASQRRVTRERVTEREEETDADEPNEESSDPAATEEVTPKPRAKKAAKKAAAKTTPQERMKELRKRAAEKAAAKA